MLWTDKLLRNSWSRNKFKFHLEGRTIRKVMGVKIFHLSWFLPLAVTNFVRLSIVVFNPYAAHVCFSVNRPFQDFFATQRKTKITFLVVLSLVISLLTVSHYRASLSGRTQGSAHFSVRNKWPKEPKCFRSSTMVQMVALSKLEIKLSNLRCHDTLWELCITDFLLK